MFFSPHHSLHSSTDKYNGFSLWVVGVLGSWFLMVTSQLGDVVSTIFGDHTPHIKGFLSNYVRVVGDINIVSDRILGNISG